MLAEDAKPVIRQTFAEPIRQNQTGGPRRAKRLKFPSNRYRGPLGHGSQNFNLSPDLGSFQFTVPAGKSMTGIKFDSQRGSHVLSRVSLREDAGILKVLSQKRKSLAAAQKKLAQSKKNKGKKGTLRLPKPT